MPCPGEGNPVEVASAGDLVLICSLREAQDQDFWICAAVVARIVVKALIAQRQCAFITAEARAAPLRTMRVTIHHLQFPPR